MHKKLVNELRLSFAIRPEGPLLIKSGREAGADPTLLDMNFVRTTHAELGETVYLPGSSLKGAIRSHCEKIGRTVGLNVCNPLDMKSGCGHKLQRLSQQTEVSGADLYHRLCPICRIFGHTVMSSHIQFSDAYPTPETVRQANRTEERDGVAIDRVSGAVAVGPFQLEVVTRGEFEARMTLRNFQLWHVGLLAVALRDMANQWLPLGFARSRGLGRVSLTYRHLEIAYPGQFGQTDGRDFQGQILGVTTFLTDEEIKAYDYTPEEPLVPAARPEVEKEWGRVTQNWTRPEAIEAVLKATVTCWAGYVKGKGGVNG
ncbi:MAG: CRISPR-associated protein [Chloroflexi bacterium]|nr:MAG: CRISPR-associated protein [Chloroflexota bacterium]